MRPFASHPLLEKMMQNDNYEVLSEGQTVLIRNADGSMATWTMDFREKSYKYQCRLTVDKITYSGLGSTPERAMGSAANKYMRKKARL